MYVYVSEQLNQHPRPSLGTFCLTRRIARGHGICG